MPWPWVQDTTTSKLDALGPAARADFDFLKFSKIESWGKKHNLGFRKNTLSPGPLKIRGGIFFDFFFFELHLTSPECVLDS